ncbi:hypothetical protein WJ39_17960 [Burkholderia diffusa]|nr:hypothetical protein WJ39_17960 [Burkholderia diffusa]
MRVQRVPLPAIASHYYDAVTTPYEDEPALLERRLKTMRDDLVHLALLNGSSVLAECLKGSIRQHGHAPLTAVSPKMVEAAARLAAAASAPDHEVGLWFRPPIARRLVEEGIATLGAGRLVACAGRVVRRDDCRRRRRERSAAAERVGGLC